MKAPDFIDNSKQIQGLWEIQCDIFRDKRGANFEGYNPRWPWLAGDFTYATDSYSWSKKNVLRGFHGDSWNDKLISCPVGKIQLFVIDVRPQSPTKDKVAEFNIVSDYPTFIFVPRGVVNAHLVISDMALFSYKLSSGYVPLNGQIHVKWNDPKYAIDWAINKPILSDRDK